MNDSEKELPLDWTRKPLKAVCQINPHRPRQINRLQDASTTFVPMSAVDEVSGTIRCPESKPFSAVSRGYTYFEERDVLFAKITPCMQNGKHAIAKGLIDGIGFGTTEFHVLRPSEQIISEWIHYYLRQPTILRRAELAFTGSAGQQRVPVEFLEELEIPVPSIHQQHHIIAILDQKLAAVDKARAAAQAQLNWIQALPVAFLRQAFVGEL